MTGLYDAKVDRAPVLAISGQVPSSSLGRGAFQDLDLPAAFADVAGYSQTVLPGSDHAELMTLACKHALLDRSVGHLILPDEVQVAASGAEAGLMDLLEEAWIKGSAGSILEFAGEGDDAGQIGSGGLAIVVAAEIGVRSPLAEDLFPVLDLGGDLVTE